MLRLVTITVGVLFSVAVPAASADWVVGGGGGVIALDKQAAVPVTGQSAIVELSLGARVHPRSLVKLKVLGFRADGLNTVVALAAELDVVDRYAGVSGAAGFSLGAESRGGNYAGAGVYGRVPLGRLALRVDLIANTVSRTDFAGFGVLLTGGVEVAWSR